MLHHTDRFRVMGTDASVTVVGGVSSLASVARGRLFGLERRWSRFDPASEVSRLNAAGGHSCRVSEETLMLLRRAADGRQATLGRFDPWCLDAVESVGYRTTFEHIDRPTVTAPVPGPVGGVPVEFDPDGRTVSMAPDVRFDAGGIGKGLAADLVVEELLELGAAGVCVSLGGDVRVAGWSPTGDGWRIDVRDLGDEAPAAEVVLADGAVATTSRSRRRWVTADGETRHHLIDPATGTTAIGDVICATAVASTGWQAEVLATLAFLDGVAGLQRAEALGATARIVLEAGVIVGERWTSLPEAEVAA